MLILTNFERFPARWTAKTGQTGTGEMAKPFSEFAARARNADVLMINGDSALILRLCALFLVCPWRRKPVVAVDLVLRRPRTFQARITVIFKKLLLRRVDLFVNYFEDITGYRQYYGINKDRCAFVPFKPNLRYRVEVDP